MAMVRAAWRWTAEMAGTHKELRRHGKKEEEEEGEEEKKKKKKEKKKNVYKE